MIKLNAFGRCVKLPMLVSLSIIFDELTLDAGFSALTGVQKVDHF
jgi:hypothetical protein